MYQANDLDFDLAEICDNIMFNPKERGFLRDIYHSDKK
jgi:hypothetical protein